MSFGQEIKDFISAYSAGKKMFGGDDDAQYKKLRNEYMAARTARLKGDGTVDPAKGLRLQAAQLSLQDRVAAIKDRSRRRDWEIEDRAEARAAGTGGGSAIPTAPPAEIYNNPPAAAGAAAIPTGEVPAEYSHGGTVQRFAEGGSVEEDDLDDAAVENDTLSKGGIPLEEEAAAPAASDKDDDEETSSGSDLGYSTLAAHDAVREGMQYNLQRFGVGKSAPREAGIPNDEVSAQRRNPGARAYTRGEGGISPEDLARIKKEVDSDGKLSESNRNMKAIAHVYQFYMGNGEYEKARAVAGGMVQTLRHTSQRYAAIAEAAARDNNLDGAAKAAVKAYESIPNGVDIKLERRGDRFAYSFTDPSGKVVQRGVATGEEMASQAMGLAAGGFDKYIMEAAGMRAAPPAKTAAAPKAANVAPYETRAETPRSTLTEVLEGAKDDNNPTGKVSQYSTLAKELEKSNPAKYREVKQNLERILVDIDDTGYKGHPKVAADFVINAALVVNPDNPNALPKGMSFKDGKDGKDGVATYKGEEFKLTPKILSAIKTMRDEALEGSYTTGAKKKATEQAADWARQRFRDLKERASDMPPLHNFMPGG